MASEPLTLADLFGDQPAEQVVCDTYGDGVELFLGHIDAGQANQRITAQPWWIPGLVVDEASLDHAHVTFDAHAPRCTAPDGAVPGRDCDCAWEPWIAWHWHDARPDNPAAVAVTFAELVQVPWGIAAA
ncbi:hypothetical protein ABZV93_04530 [Actinopolymorpha sp. NPDC004070]|uniref:hypothetical protein n=1 Tax=Actinopolymorpha sp. NPDC004070 TaxID=3154548 RepID=UPI0033A1A6A9